MAINVKDKLVTVEALAEAYNALKAILDRIGVSNLNTNPSMRVDLSTTDAANVMQANPRPGVIGTLPIARGGTGGNTAEQAKANLGLGTEDMNFSVINTASNNQAFHLRARVKNANYPERYDRMVMLYPSENGIGFYDYDNSESIWSLNVKDMGDPVVVGHGGTGASTAAKAKENLGIGTEDMNFTVSDTASQDQAFTLRATVKNNNYPLRKDHQVILYPSETGLGFFDANEGTSIWRINDIGDPVTIEHGGTGATSAEMAKSHLGLGTSAMNFRVQNSTSPDQAFLMYATVQNDSYPTRKGNTVILYPTETGMGFFDSTAGEPIWTINANANIVAASGEYDFGEVAAGASANATVQIGITQKDNKYMVLTESLTGGINVGVQHKYADRFDLYIQNITNPATATNGLIRWAVIRMS